MASDSFSAAMMTGAFVLPEAMVEKIDASATRRPREPCTRRPGNTSSTKHGAKT